MDNEESSETSSGRSTPVGIILNIKISLVFFQISKLTLLFTFKNFLSFINSNIKFEKSIFLKSFKCCINYYFLFKFLVDEDDEENNSDHEMQIVEQEHREGDILFITENVDVEEILNANFQCSIILKYKNRGVLTETKRNKIVACILLHVTNKCKR